MTLSSGARLGPYEILTAIGAGGMGEVYKARDTRLDRSVAIKVLPRQFSADPERRARFEREARAISHLSHPHICALFDVGREGNTDYLVMEYLEGETLAQRLARVAARTPVSGPPTPTIPTPSGTAAAERKPGRAGRPLPLEETLRIGTELAEALAAAHKAAIIHRDLKPGNVMLTAGGVKVLDFGLAKLQPTGTAPDATSAATRTADPLTDAGTRLGTIPYMAPEQVEGRQADARSDIFALGAVLYEMTTGRRAFEGKSYISVASAILEKEPEPLTVAQPLSPPALDHVVRTCLAKDPEQRYQAAHDVALELKWISVTGSQAGALAPVARRRKWRLWLLWAAAAVVALAAALAAGWYWRDRRPGPVLRATITLPADSELGAFDSGVAFSPDGRRLAVTITKGLKASLWLRSLDSKEAQPLAGTDGASYPTWSADGRSLAFFADHKLKRIDLATGIVQAVCDAQEGRGMAWGPDNTIVFSPNVLSGLFTVAAAGGTPTELTTRAHAGITHRHPLFLPGGKVVLFFNVAPGQSHGELDAVDLKTKEVRRVLDADSGARYVSPGYLLYIQAGTLVAQRFDASALKAIGPAVPVVESVRLIAPLFAGIFDVSTRGDLAYAERASGRNQWTWFDRGGNILGKVGDPTPLGLTYTTAALSPDNRTVATEDRDSQAIWLFDLVRGTSTRLTFEPGFHARPVWSPDSQSVVYVNEPPRGRGWTLSRRAANGTGAPQVIYQSATPATPTSWSPDGKYLAVTVPGPGAESKNDIWLLPVSGNRKPFPFVQGDTSSSYGQFSPDGRWFLYTAQEAGHTHFYVVPFPGRSGKWQVPTEDATGFAVWLSEGEIAYATGDLRLFAVPVRTAGGSVEFGRPQPLLGSQALRLTVLANYNGLWTHDGKRLLMALPAEASATPQLNLVTNWTATLKR